MNATHLQSFLSNATSKACIEFSAARTGADKNRVSFLLHTYAAEVPIVLSLLQDIPLHQRRLLDVGAGIGLTSFFLFGEGHNITALEPGGLGFDLNQSLFVALRDYFGANGVSLISTGAENLSAHEHGKFDVMFSANVLEHVSDLNGVINAMAKTLSDDGILVHTCPNYTIPYEPHYNMLLLPFAPARTPWVGRRKEDNVWRGLNFITARRLERLLWEAGLQPRFEKGTMSRAFERLLRDPVFASRHPSFAMLAHLMQATGALYLMKNLSARFSTPLVVTARKRDDTQ